MKRRGSRSPQRWCSTAYLSVRKTGYLPVRSEEIKALRLGSELSPMTASVGHVINMEDNPLQPILNYNQYLKLESWERIGLISARLNRNDK